MSEARDMERAALTAMEAARSLRGVLLDLAEERRQLDWAVQRLQEERLAFATDRSAADAARPVVRRVRAARRAVAGSDRCGGYAMTTRNAAPLSAAEEAEIRESFAAGMRQGCTATAVFAREDIARLLATLDRERAAPSLDVERLAEDGRKWRTAEAEGHVVTFSETGYGLMHPPSCRPDLIGCHYNEWLAGLGYAEEEPGHYRMTFHEDGFAEYARLAAIPVAEEKP